MFQESNSLISKLIFETTQSRSASRVFSIFIASSITTTSPAWTSAPPGPVVSITCRMVFNGISTALYLAERGYDVHVVEANVVAPKVFERQVRLPPVWTLLSVLIALKLLGPIGMIVAVRAPAIAYVVRRWTAPAGALALAAVIVYGIWYFYDTLWPALPLIGGIAVVHNASAFLLGFGVALAMRAERSARRALTFEVGIQNSGLALVILLGQLKGQGGAAAMAAIWGVWHLIAGMSLAIICRYIDRSGGPTEPVPVRTGATRDQ